MKMLKILIVEDELIFAHEMKLWLTDGGYEVVGLTSQGDKAVNMAFSLDPDLIIMDVQLRGNINGVQAALQIREKKEIPVVFLTGNPNLSSTLKRTSLESAAIITKPVSEYKLLDMLNSLKNK